MVLIFGWLIHPVFDPSLAGEVLELCSDWSGVTLKGALCSFFCQQIQVFICQNILCVSHLKALTNETLGFPKQVFLKFFEYSIVHSQKAGLSSYGTRHVASMDFLLHTPIK